MNATNDRQTPKPAVPMRVGLIGLGRMGKGMGHRVLEAGFPLTVRARHRQSGASLLAAGATWAESPAELARSSKVALLSLPNETAVEEVLFGSNGLVEGISSGAIVIDLSTISPAAAKEFAERLGEHGVELLDAPVSGGSEGARRGTLSAMVGGDAEALERAHPVLEVLATTITHIGGHGMGQAAKMVNQVVVVGNIMSMSEGLLLASRYGLDVEKTLRALQGGAAGSWMLSNMATRVIERDWTPSFTIELQLKDLRIALETADACGIPLLGTSMVFQLYRALAAHGFDQDGNHSLIRALEALATGSSEETPNG
jgi:3-hydroxyisobutyrate dehydrogenase